MKKGALIAGVALVAIIAFYNLTENKSAHTVDNKQERQDFNTAKGLIADSNPQAAIKIIEKYKTEMESLSENGSEWLNLFIQALKESRDIDQLVLVFEFHPEAFKKNETGALLIQRYYLVNGKISDYMKVRSLWEGQETKKGSWFALDADQLLLEGRRDEAIELLKSTSFEGSAEHQSTDPSCPCLLK